MSRRQLCVMMKTCHVCVIASEGLSSMITWLFMFYRMKLGIILMLTNSLSIIFPYKLPRCMFSVEEAGRYLETYKSFEKKPPDLIMERTEANFLAQVG